MPATNGVIITFDHDASTSLFSNKKAPASNPAEASFVIFKWLNSKN